MLDLNEAEKQNGFGELIPDNAVVPVHMTVRPGGAGDDGWLKLNKDGNCVMIDCEFTVTEGQYARRKFWTLLTVQGETDGQKKAADISRSRLRAALESARGISPADESEQACNGRRVSSYADFDGLRFLAVVGLEKGKDGYKDKNVLKAIVTPDRKEWVKIEQVNKTHPGIGAVAAANAAKQGAVKASIGRPSWA